MRRAPPEDPATPLSSDGGESSDDYCALPEALPVTEPARPPEAEPPPLPAPLAMPETDPLALPAALPAAPVTPLAVEDARFRVFVTAVPARLRVLLAVVAT